jgi:hypothetical protein
MLTLEGRMTHLPQKEEQKLRQEKMRIQGEQLTKTLRKNKNFFIQPLLLIYLLPEY